jgi:hypothetical protein
MAVHLNVIINVNSRRFPVRILIGSGWQGLDRGPVKGLEQLLPTARQLLERAGIENNEQPGDLPVQLR